jgi:hypothetical protein
LPNVDTTTGQQYATINSVRLPSGSSQKIVEQIFLPNPYVTAKFNSNVPSRGSTGNFFDPYEWICSHVYNKCFYTLQAPATTLKFINSKTPLINYSIHDYNMFNLGSVLTCMVVTLDAEIYNFPMIYNQLTTTTTSYNDYTSTNLNIKIYDPFDLPANQQVTLNSRKEVDDWVTNESYSYRAF